MQSASWGRAQVAVRGSFFLNNKDLSGGETSAKGQGFCSNLVLRVMKNSHNIDIRLSFEFQKNSKKPCTGHTHNLEPIFL